MAEAGREVAWLGARQPPSTDREGKVVGRDRLGAWVAECVVCADVAGDGVAGDGVAECAW